MPRTPKELARIRRTSDHYERLFRARFVRAMKDFQRRLSRERVAAAMSNRKLAEQVITAELDAALAPLADIFVRAYMSGGEIGAEHVREIVRG